MAAPKKYTWPTKEQFMQYKADNYSAVEVSSMTGIPLKNLQRKLADHQISLRPNRTPRFPGQIAITEPAEIVDFEAQEAETAWAPLAERETPEDFVARGGQITYLPAETVPYAGRGPAHHFGGEIDV